MFLNPVYVICSLTGQTKVLFTATEIVFVLQIKFNWLLAFFTVSVSFEVDREGGRERNIITPLPRHRFEISRGLILFYFFSFSIFSAFSTTNSILQKKSPVGAKETGRIVSYSQGIFFFWGEKRRPGYENRHASREKLAWQINQGNRYIKALSECYCFGKVVYKDRPIK